MANRGDRILATASRDTGSSPSSENELFMRIDQAAVGLNFGLSEFDLSNYAVVLQSHA